jgi:hypothetical protein
VDGEEDKSLGSFFHICMTNKGYELKWHNLISLIEVLNFDFASSWT